LRWPGPERPTTCCDFTSGGFEAVGIAVSAVRALASPDDCTGGTRVPPLLASPLLASPLPASRPAPELAASTSDLRMRPEGPERLCHWPSVTSVTDSPGDGMVMSMGMKDLRLTIND